MMRFIVREKKRRKKKKTRGYPVAPAACSLQMLAIR